MELPRFGKFEPGGMLNGIKSKLGFADASGGRNDDAYYDDYDGDYGEYGEDFDEQEPLRNNGAPSSRYEPYNPVTTRTPRATGARASRATDGGFPKLVSIDDVRARTQVPDSLNRDPLPARRVSSSVIGGYRGDRTVVDTTMPAPSSPAHNAAMRERSEGLDSLFSPTANDSASKQNSFAAPSQKEGGNGLPMSAAGGSFDPYEAYAGAGSAAHSPARSISVLKPTSYGEVERVAKCLKAGDAVVLALSNTPDQLSKRILDFSFGVSSALDANVECVSNKVFAITRGSALSDAERVALRNQGVL